MNNSDQLARISIVNKGVSAIFPAPETSLWIVSTCG
jgi:hypothetical protein